MWIFSYYFVQSKGKKPPQDASGTAPTEGKAKSKSRNTYRLEPRTKVQDDLLRDKAQAILTVWYYLNYLSLCNSSLSCRSIYRTVNIA